MSESRLAYVYAYGRLSELVRLYLAGLAGRDQLADMSARIEAELRSALGTTEPRAAG